jgi:hypothetical protein
MVKDRMSVIDAAKALLPKEFAFDGKTLGDIRKAAVSAKLGDAAVNMDDAAIGGAFAALTADAKAAGGGAAVIADAFASRKPGAGAPPPLRPVTRPTASTPRPSGMRGAPRPPKQPRQQLHRR